MRGTMKTAICYATKNGTTKECAEMLKKQLPDAILCNIETDKADLSKYECIVVGGCIRMGKLHKAAAKFIQENRTVLLEKKCAFFICNGFPDQAEAFLVQNIDKELLSHSICAASFGGKMDLDKLRGMDRFIAKAVVNSMKNDLNAVPKILPENIKQFADTVNQM